MSACAAGRNLRDWPLEPGLLERAIEPSASRRAWLVQLLSGDTSAYASLTAGDLLYDAFRIDPGAIAAIDFARAADLSDILGLSRFSADLSALGSDAFAGNLAQLQGYVAERCAAATLQAQGADVEFPRLSTQPGWDLLVNGEPFQVKCLANPSGVEEHLARYPEIPVIANVELADSFAGDERVIPLSGLSHSEVMESTQGMLDGAADLIDLEIPLITGAVVAGRAALAMLRRESDPLSALAAASMSGVGGVTGGTVGAATVGAALGLLGVTGGWAAIVAPAAGSIAGFRAGQTASNVLKRGLLCRREADALAGLTREFARAAVVVLDRMIAGSIRYREAVLRMATEGGPFMRVLHQDWLRRVDLEIDHRAFFRRRLAQAAREPWLIGPDLRDPRTLAATVVGHTIQGGMILANLRRESSRLQVAIDQYDLRAKRWLLD